jgi:hypothetical protein
VDAPPVEMLREVSARQIAKIVGISHYAAVEQLEQIPQAYQTPGGVWRCPLWAYYEHQKRRGE